MVSVGLCVFTDVHSTYTWAKFSSCHQWTQPLKCINIILFCCVKNKRTPFTRHSPLLRLCFQCCHIRIIRSYERILLFLFNWSFFHGSPFLFIFYLFTAPYILYFGCVSHVFGLSHIAHVTFSTVLPFHSTDTFHFISFFCLILPFLTFFCYPFSSTVWVSVSTAPSSRWHFNQNP